MGWRRTTPDVPPPPPPAQPAVLMTTVDTLPQRYEILGLVQASQQVAIDQFPTDMVLDALGNEALSMGADAVIGIQMSQTFIPGMSRERVLGQVTDHYGGVVRVTALGTAVRRLAAAPPGKPTTYARAHGG